MMHTILIVFLFLIISQTCNSAAIKKLTSAQCLDHGFNGELLACQTCSYVAQVFGDQSEPNNACLSCCIPDANNMEETFAKAVLEVDKRFVQYMPEIEYIVKNKRKHMLIRIFLSLILHNLLR